VLSQWLVLYFKRFTKQSDHINQFMSRLERQGQGRSYKLSKGLCASLGFTCAMCR
jgi:hypothetical protein